MGSGINTSIDMLGETVWGTKATGTYVTVPFASCDIGLKENTATASNIDTNPAPERVWRQGVWAAGTISGVPTYENLEPFLRGVLGDPTSAGVASPYTNTYDPVITIPQYTISVDADDRSGSCYYWTGCKIGSLSLSFSTSGDPSFSASVIGATGAIAAAQAGPTVLSGTVIAPGDWVAWNIGDGGSATSACVETMTINFDWGLAPGKTCLGSSGAAKEPKVQQKISVTGSFTLSEDDGSAWDKYLADTETTAIALRATGPTAATEDITFTVGRARYTDGTGYNINGAGDVVYTVNWAAFDNDATEPIQVVTINTVEADTVLTE